MWLVRTFWKLCGGVFTIDLTYNKLQCLISILVLATCVHNLITEAQALCIVKEWCTIFSPTLIAMYDRVLASTTLFSRIALMYTGKRYILRYKSTIKALETYSSTPTMELKNYKIFSFFVVFLYLFITLPINASRLYYLYYHETHYSVSLVVYFIFMYLQNLSVCCIETQFITQCFMIYTNFQEINEDLKKLKTRNVNYAKYPFLLGLTPIVWDNPRKFQRCVRYNEDFYGQRWPMNHLMANTVEILRIKHWLTRQAFSIINNLFGIQMGLSVFLLWVMALFDIYYEIFHDSLSKVLFFGSQLQYWVRFLMIVLVAHKTMKQVRKKTFLF